MALYRYQANLNEGDRYSQIEIARDDGSAMVMEMGHTYDITTNELARARQRVVMVSSSSPATSPAKIVYLPLIGPVSDGDVPVWSEAQGAFVPGSGGGGGGGGSTSWEDPVTALGDLPTTGNAEGDVRLVGNDLTLYAWHHNVSLDSFDWVPLAGGGGSGGGVIADYIDISWSSTGLDVGESPIWNAALSRFEPGVL